jgi:hypothetical protein
MAYCTTCLDVPIDASSVVRERGLATGVAVGGGERSGLGRARLIGCPAILDMPVGHGHMVAFNFNPLYRDLNRGDQRLLWNAIINWRAILAAKRRAAEITRE